MIIFSLKKKEKLMIIFESSEGRDWRRKGNLSLGI